MSFTSEEIMAYADGEVDEITARRIEEAAKSDPELSSLIDAHRSLRGTMAERFDPVLDEPVPDKLRAPLETVDTSLEDRRAEKAGLGRPMQWGAIAVSLVLGLFAGFQLQPDDMVSVRADKLVAQGALDGALNKQLASRQGDKPKVRIGLTFRDKAGTYCRTFESRALSGIACKEQDDWLLRRAFEGTQNSDYRLASSGDLADAAARMMEQSGPLDATAEERARQNDWQPLSGQ